MSLAALIRDMAAVGAPAEAIALAVEAIERAQAQVDTTRAAAAERQRRKRARDRDTSRDSHATVTGHVTLEPSPSPPPLLSPQTPQTTPPPLPHPDTIRAHTRGPQIGWIVLAVIVEACRAQIAAQRPKPVAVKARWQRNMPPPPGVTDDQWAGFVAHRLAKRSPLTPRAYDLLTGKLARYATDLWPPGAIIDTIVERGWTSFEHTWLSKITDTDHAPRPRHDRSSGWTPRPGMEGVEPAYLDD
ncbi:hypothetical protein ASE75_06105 [Sphingomonas sp. Leaf17]|uniref:hypothetical protein n=1 Tax=Sphingomonas sp. Leaf17 TaxID=1735683 RepID=UPI0006FDF74A|nr:hypothetical protein [Sphingomonas sp. Leaf17]KQM65801.1 hypothetical protein ASE75_06105 [Sphingomonas sp. Leaf17]